MNSLLNVWQEIIDQNLVGLNKQKYGTETIVPIFATYHSEYQYYGIAFSFKKGIRIDVSKFDSLQEIQTKVISDTTYANSKVLVIQLTHHQNHDIFATLCEYLVQTINHLSSEQEVATTIIRQLKKWEGLFSRANRKGLTLEQQQGLFGELCFLKKCFCKNQDYNAVLEKWVGTEAAVRDFRGEKWAVEIKTTSATKIAGITINGERQLDDSLIDNLFLYHYLVERSELNGKSLYALVQEIRTILLASDMEAYKTFNAKLVEIEYFDHDEDLYQKTTYVIRKESIYSVCDDFPRIRENELRKNVANITYKIVPDDRYLITENKLFNTIKL